MKKSCLGMLVCIAALFSSCLGDNETTYTGGVDFAVIMKTDEQGLYATTYSGFRITWDGINKYSSGDAVALSSFYLKDYNTSDIVKADYANVSATFPVAGQLSVTSGIADTTSNITNKIAVTSLSVLAHQPEASWLDDKWEIAYAYDKKEGQTYNLKFVYDATKQKLKGQDLPANTVIVDIFVDKNGEGIGTTTEKKTQAIVVNFNKLRATIAPATTTAVTMMNIQFRLTQLGTNSTYTNTNMLAGKLYYPAK